MSFVHSHSFYTTIDLLCRNLSTALSICQQGTNANTNALAAQNITKHFSSLIGQVSDAYAHVSPPLVLPNTTTNPSLKQEIDKAVESAMSIRPTTDDVCGGVPFNHPSGVDMAVDAQSSSDEDSDESLISEDSSIDIESMLPGQRENYVKTKKFAEGLRRARMTDTNFLNDSNT